MSFLKGSDMDVLSNRSNPQLADFELLVMWLVVTAVKDYIMTIITIHLLRSI
jgi:hypothetical protein